MAEDPQVKAAFGLVDSIAFGMVTPEMKTQGLDVGADDEAGTGPRAAPALSRRTLGPGACRWNRPRAKKTPEKP